MARTFHSDLRPPKRVWQPTLVPVEGSLEPGLPLDGKRPGWPVCNFQLRRMVGADGARGTLVAAQGTLTLQPQNSPSGTLPPGMGSGSAPRNVRASKQEPQLCVTRLRLPAGPGVGGRVLGNPATLYVAQGPAREVRSGW